MALFSGTDGRITFTDAGGNFTVLAKDWTLTFTQETGDDMENRKKLFTVAVLLHEDDATALLVLPTDILATTEKAAEFKAAVLASEARQGVDTSRLEVMVRPF